MTFHDHDRILRTRSIAGMVSVAALIAASLVASGSFFVVQPTEMAGVRRLGTVRTAEPLEPGFYLKWPLIETADRLQVSQDSYRIDDLKVNTIDNQPVVIAIGVTYRIPRDAVLKLLYQVGQPGDFDIQRNINQIISDRALSIFARRNTVKISEERALIAAEIRVAVTTTIRDMYGVEIFDLQIPSIQYSPNFIQSVESAVRAKNEAIAAENTVNRFRYEGQQRVVAANADAEAQIAAATAQKQAQILAAEGEARAIELKGQAEAASIRARSDAVRGQSGLVGLVLAERWNGQPPQTILGGANTAVPFFNIQPAQQLPADAAPSEKP